MITHSFRTGGRAVYCAGTPEGLGKSATPSLVGSNPTPSAFRKFLRKLFRRKPSYVPLHKRPWRPINYKIIALHIEAATRFTELAR